MDDLISREAVADAINGIECTRHTTWYEFYQKVMTAVEKLPSAEPKRGLWIDDGSELGCQCSQCGKTLDEYINCGTEYMTLTEIPKFCSNCGADMRGGENDGCSQVFEREESDV